MATIGAANLCGVSASKRQIRWRAANDRRDVIEFDKPEIRRDDTAPYDHGVTVAVAMAWLAFYAIAAIQHLVASTG